MKKLLLYACAGSFLLISCKKDNEDDEEPTACTGVETPADYFPAYSGTVWNYRDQNNNLVTYTIHSELNSDCWPVLNQIPATVIGKNFQSHVTVAPGIGGDYYSTIYSLDTGDVSYCYVSFATMHKIESLVGPPPYARVATDTTATLTVPGFPTFEDIVIMKEYNGDSPGHHYLEYFAKNVGLVRRDSINDANPGNPVTILLLESYDLGD